MSNVIALTSGQRRANYARQNGGSSALTPPQRRRLRKKDNQAMSRKNS